MGLFLYAVIHWNARDDRDAECLRHTKYDDEARSATGIVIEAALVFAVILSSVGEAAIAFAFDSLPMFPPLHNSSKNDKISSAKTAKNHTKRKGETL